MNGISYELVGLIAALLGQAAMFVWWLSSLNSKVGALNDRISDVEAEQKSQERSLTKMNTSVAVIEERTKAMSESLNRLVMRLDHTEHRSA